MDTMKDSKEQLINDDKSSSFKSDTAFLKQGRISNEMIDYYVLDKLKESEDFDESKLYQYLNQVSEEVLLSLLQELIGANDRLTKENNIYEFALKEDKSIQNALEMLEMDVRSHASEDTYACLLYPAKCYFADKKLKQLKKNLEQKTSIWLGEIQDLKFILESLNISLETLKEAKENFIKNVRFGGRHPVTKKVILQKVARYFDDSIKSKMAMTNRYKIQIQSDIMERNKLLSQIKEQEKRLASLDLMKYKEAKFEHENSCKSLLKHKEQLAKCKSKYSSLVQSVAEIKRVLEKEEREMKEIQVALSKKEYMKSIVISEKARNVQKVEELNAAMHKIKLDPRRHGLPEVAEYAVVKRENEILKQTIKKWQKKVAVAEQAKWMHLSALKKKKKQR